MKINKDIQIENTNYSLGTIALKTISIVDVTQSQSGRYITSKIPFNTNGVLFFIFQAVGAWSNDVCQIAIFNSDNKRMPIISAWHNPNEVYMTYGTVFQIQDDMKTIVAVKYAQDGNMINGNWNWCSDTDWGAIRPNKIYAVCWNKNIV